ncbi:MAG: hypothetical protein JW894_09905 [Bacteroidales bacterium]|nr:hypothetical protein [Bacteroidales bacterium]
MWKCINLIIAFIFSGIYCFPQHNEVWFDTGFNGNDTIVALELPDNNEIIDYISSLRLENDNIAIGGYISSIFHESIDSAQIEIFSNSGLIGKTITESGLFRLGINRDFNSKVLSLKISHPEYYILDTIIITDPKLTLIKTKLMPRYKILLRGRVFAGNLPLEGVEVRVNHINDTYKLKTRGCYYDGENYWNCLYNGMFKVVLTAYEPSDSISIDLNKNGMKPYTMGMRFDEYSGEIMNIKMKYDKYLPEVPLNNINLKLAFPFSSFDDDWFVSLSYYRLINANKLKRVAFGIDGNMFITTLSVNHETFPGVQASKDSSYITGFVGPSVLIWLISPDRRNFSSYIGSTFGLKLNNPEFVFQPVIGTRLFLDINKALSLECRYSAFDIDVVNYTFNSYGDADRYTVRQHFNKININLGIQIVF